MNGNVPRDFGRCECRIEAERVGPDGTQKGAGFFVAQVVEKDSVTVAIWKLVVALPLPREISIKLNHMSYVHDQEEGRPAVFLGDRAGIIISLVAGLEHGAVPAGSAPHPVAGALLLAVRDPLGQIALAVFLLVYALLCLEHEMTAAIDIDEASAVLVGVGKSNGSFKSIMVVCVIVRCRKWAIQPEQVGQLDHEKLVVGLLTATGWLPACNELVNLRVGRHLEIDFSKQEIALFKKDFEHTVYCHYNERNGER